MLINRITVLFCMVLSAVFFFTSEIIVNAEVRGVTDTEIIIGSTMDQSGPVAFLGSTMKDAVATYFKYVNDKGGIHGRKIKFLVEDDGYQSPRAVLAARKLITKDNVFCMFQNIGAAAIEAMYPLLEQYKVPLFMIGANDSTLVIPPRKYLFLTSPTLVLQGIMSVKFAVENLQGGNMKPAIIFQDDAPGHQYRDGLRKGFEKYGIKNWPELSYKRGTVDFSSQISVCKQKGITHVFFFASVREPAAMLKEAQRLDYKAYYITSTSSSWNKVLELAGDSVDFTNGFYAMNTIGDPNNKIFEPYREFARKYNLKNPNEILVQGSVASAMIMEEILQRAGRNLTVESAIKAAETLKDYEVGLGAPVTFTPDRRDGGRAVMITKAVKGKWVLLTDKWQTVD